MTQVLVLVRLSDLVGVVWLRLYPSVGIMSPVFYPRPDGGSTFVGGRVEVCLRRILRGSIYAGLWWIFLDPVFICLSLGVYRFNPFNLCLFSSAMVAALVR